MKSFLPHFRRLKQIASVGLLISTAGILLSLPAPSVRAGQIPSPPKWIPYEMNAIGLLESGMNQESSDPQDAVKTLVHARQESTAAIANGGGANWAVMHNDWVIGQYLMMAETGTAKTPENKPEKQQASQGQKSGGNSLSISLPRPTARHIQVAIKVH